MSSAIASGPIRTIALSGQAAPGTDGGVVFSEFNCDHSYRFPISNIDLNNNGHVAFHAYLAGDEVDTNATGIWRDLGDGLSPVALTNDVAPGAASRTFKGFHPPTLHDNGDVAVFGYLTEQQDCPHGSPCEPREFGIWTQQPGGPLRLAVKSDTTLIDGDTTMTVDHVIGVSTSQRDQAKESLQILVSGVSEAIAEEASRDYGVWSVSTAGTQRLLVQRGDPAPGLPVGFKFDNTIGRPQLDAQGQLGFRGTASEPGGDGPTQFGIWSGGIDGGLSLLVVAGDSAPGPPGSNRIFTSFDSPQFNALGQAAFTAQTTGPEVGRVGRTGEVWREAEDGKIVLVAREYEATPGVPDATFRLFHSSSVVINDLGQVAFSAVAWSPTSVRYGIWTEGPGQELSLLAGEGYIAPGTSGGQFVGAVPAPVINNRGQTAFLGSALPLEGGVKDGIWAQDIYGDLQLIALQGDSLDVSNDASISDRRIVEELGFSSSNDRGQVAFWARFADGSEAVLLSNAIAVPEPGNFALMLSAGLWLNLSVVRMTWLNERVGCPLH